MGKESWKRQTSSDTRSLHDTIGAATIQNRLKHTEVLNSPSLHAIPKARGPIPAAADLVVDTCSLTFSEKKTCLSPARRWRWQFTLDAGRDVSDWLSDRR